MADIRPTGPNKAPNVPIYSEIPSFRDEKPDVKKAIERDSANVAVAMASPQVKALMKLLNIVPTTTETTQYGTTFNFVDKGPIVPGLDQRFVLWMEWGLSSAVIQKRLLAGLDGRIKLKAAILLDQNIQKKADEYHINLNKIELIPFGPIESLGSRIFYRGGYSDRFHIVLNANLSAEDMGKELIREIPKYANEIKKAKEKEMALEIAAKEQLEKAAKDPLKKTAVEQIEDNIYKKIK